MKEHSMSAPDNFPESLLDAYLTGKISRADEVRLMQWFDGFSDEEIKVVLDSKRSKQAIKEGIWRKVEKTTGVKLAENLVANRNVDQNGKLSYVSYAAVAAAAVIMILVGWWAVHLINNKNNAAPGHLTAEVRVPGAVHNGAILTLSNGKVVRLDSSVAGQIATDGGAKLLLADGKLRYANQADEASAAPQALLNKVVTPKGKQFSMVLPDGTKVWLNAASSITYPVQFAKNMRNVSVTGEVYFEVAHLTGPDHTTRIPFSVQSGDLKIKVLGTHFDVRNYPDENEVKTTLLEGQVSISYGQDMDERRMHPGQQATLNRAKPNSLTFREIDANRAIAWKDGLFDFKDEPLDDILKEVSRWYNVTATADPSKGKLRFSGVVSKRAELADLLNVLSATGVVHFKIRENEVYGY
jgi:ferric-dicitrate binding protein FerR (iron transport regulator)